MMEYDYTFDEEYDEETDDYYTNDNSELGNLLYYMEVSGLSYLIDDSYFDTLYDDEKIDYVYKLLDNHNKYKKETSKHSKDIDFADMLMQDFRNKTKAKCDIEFIKVDNSLNDTIDYLKEISIDIKTLQKEYNRVREDLFDTANNKGLCTDKYQLFFKSYDSESFDKISFKKDYPDLYKKYISIKKYKRIFIRNYYPNYSRDNQKFQDNKISKHDETNIPETIIYHTQEYNQNREKDDFDFKIEFNKKKLLLFKDRFSKYFTDNVNNMFNDFLEDEKRNKNIEFFTFNVSPKLYNGVYLWALKHLDLNHLDK